MMIREIVSFVLYLIPLLIISSVTVYIISMLSFYFRKQKPALLTWAPIFGMVCFIFWTDLITQAHDLPMSIWITHWGWSFVTFLFALFAGILIDISTKTLEWERVSNLNVRRGISALILLLSWVLILSASAAVLILCLRLYQE